ncbi:unnamed protein product [Amoebophrya sp. A120]|nr:unnamed protein product [Amoebophrya sp. A120]|eukprot:GSA120T00015854001.1
MNWPRAADGLALCAWPGLRGRACVWCTPAARVMWFVA